MAILRSTQVNGDLTVTGSLNVQGNLTYVGVENLRVKDHQIELNANDKGSASLAGADQAGIVIRGARKSENVIDDASILYNHADDTLVVNKTIKGTVSNATKAASADKVAQKLTVNVTNESGIKTAVEFDGSEAKTVSVDLSGLQDQIDNLTGGAVGSIATQINDAIAALDSEVEATAAGGTTQKGGVLVLQGVTIREVDGKLSQGTSEVSIAEVEQAGAAAAVKTELIGKGNSDKDSDTIEGAKKYADSLASHYAAASHTHEISNVNGLQDALNGKAAVDHTHENYNAHLADRVIHITADERTAWNGKQNALNTDQLNAVDSGITADKVKEYDSHTKNTGIHVTPEDKGRWNGIEQKANKYTDDEIKKLGTAAKKNVLTGAIADSSSDDLVTAAQVKAYAAGVVGAMHFRGAVESTGSIANPASGDICLVGTKEYVYNDTEWVLFGDESAYDIKGAADEAEQKAKTYADGLNTAMDDRVKVLEGDRHNHTNKAELDKIAVGDKEKWDNHVANGDIHVTAEQKTAWSAKQDALGNADVLKTITSTQVSNWNDAFAKAHEHANKTVLDGITAKQVAAWDGAVSAAGVSSVGGKAGALTLKGGSATLGDVNLSISDTGEISAAIVPDSFDSFGSAATALNDAKAYANGLASNYDAAGAADTALSTAIGTDDDDKSANTIKGAKKYADAAVSALSGSVAVTDAAQDTKITNIEKSITGIQNNYVKKAGDTMTGNLTMPSNGLNGIIFGNMKIVWKDNAIEFIPTSTTA